MDNIIKVYKVLVRKEDGSLVSRTAGGGGFSEFRELHYKEGRITYAPEGSNGLYICATMEEALRAVRDRSGNKEGIRVIHEAVPLGEKGRDKFYDSDTYPAILLGKEICRGSAEPEPVFPCPHPDAWEDVTRQCTLRVSVDYDGIVYICLRHGGQLVRDYTRYRVEFPSNAPYHGFRILRRRGENSPL